MANTSPNRRPAGTPSGGQFAPSSHPESEVVLGGGTTLTEVEPGRWEARLPDGRLHDPDDGSPALRWCRPNGSVELECHFRCRKLQDPDDGSPAARRYRRDGSLVFDEHYQDGLFHDPDDGSPALRRFRPDGSVGEEWHFRNGELHDPDDGSPAVRTFHRDGSVVSEEHYHDGFPIKLDASTGAPPT